MTRTRTRGRDERSRPRPGLRAVGALAALVVASAAAAEREIPNGFGGARFGMSAAEVKRSYPAMEPAGGVPPATLTYYAVSGQTFLDLERCGLRFNFFGDRLYEIQFDCGRDANVSATLEREFGRPAMRESYGVFWYGEGAVLALSPGSKVFGLSDRALMVQVQQAVQRAVAAERAGGAAPPAAR